MFMGAIKALKQLTSIIEKQKNNKEHQDKIIRDDDSNTTHILMWIEMLDKAKTKWERILTAEMSWLWKIAGNSELHKSRNDGIRQFLHKETKSFSKVSSGLAMWEEDQLTECPTMKKIQDSKERAV